MPETGFTARHVVQYIPDGGRSWVDADDLEGGRETTDLDSAREVIRGNKAGWDRMPDRGLGGTGAGWPFEGGRPKAYRIVLRETQETVIEEISSQDAGPGRA